ncbi:SEC-C domain-containing protein [Flavobacterium sp. ZS1P14]|uniref:SEC-C domain-containing protein n=1 Tax=Flavobacterium sp. ZS1P14 TaxID=3401729 RepID=UPI003AAB8E57
MSLPILLDKSTFQGLNYGNIIELHRYYDVTIAPLLVNEILGDLSKEEKKGKITPKDMVINLSKKMFPYNAYVNMRHGIVIEKSLLGEFIGADNRPFLIADRSISSQGKNGLKFKETEEEKSVKRWKEGKFDNLDEIISDLWRSESKDDNVIDDFKKCFEHLADIKRHMGDSKERNKKLSDEEELKELKALKARFLERMNVELEPEEALLKMLEYFKIDSKTTEAIFHRWNSESFPDLETFAEYTFYCYSIVSMYYIGINNNLLGERKTNLLDLEYLFYAPFAKVFSTNDKFLVTLYNVIEPKGVTIISLLSLKEDLAKFQKLNTPDNWSRYPPDKDTETFKIWDKTFNLKLSGRLKPTEKDKERAKKELDEILKLAESGESGIFNGEPDFVVKQSYYSLNDPCPCKSGKALKDCHMKNR